MDNQIEEIAKAGKAITFKLYEHARRELANHLAAINNASASAVMVLNEPGKEYDKLEKVSKLMSEMDSRGNRAGMMLGSATTLLGLHDLPDKTEKGSPRDN